MPVTRSYTNGNRLVDWTDDIVNVAPTFGYITNSNMFNMRPTAQTTIQYEVSDFETVLLNETSRRERDAQKLSPRESEIYALALPYFKVVDQIVPEDLQGWIRAGTEQTALALADLTQEKMDVFRAAYDMTIEYMALSAIKGQTITPSGRVLADIFAQRGITQKVITWDLDTPTFNVMTAIRELKDYLATNLRTGGVIRGIEVIVGSEFFDKLVNHPQVQGAYYAYRQPDRPIYLSGGETYQAFGITSTFTYQDVTFLTYPATFNIKNPDGTIRVEKAIEADEGYPLLRGVRDLYRGYYGPSNKLSGANRAGSPLYVYEWEAPRDEGYEFEMEFSHLYFGTQPQIQVKLQLG